MPNSAKTLIGEPIDTDRLRLRQFVRGDIEPFTRFMTDQESTRFLKYLGRNIYRLGERIRVVSAAFLCN